MKKKENDFDRLVKAEMEKQVRNRIRNAAIDAADDMIRELIEKHQSAVLKTLRPAVEKEIKRAVLAHLPGFIKHCVQDLSF